MIGQSEAAEALDKIKRAGQLRSHPGGLEAAGIPSKVAEGIDYPDDSELYWDSDAGRWYAKIPSWHVEED